MYIRTKSPYNEKEWILIGATHDNYTPGHPFDFDYTKYKEIRLIMRQQEGESDARVYSESTYTMDLFLSSNYPDGNGGKMIYQSYNAHGNTFGSAWLKSLTEGKVYLGVYNTSSMWIYFYAR